MDYTTCERDNDTYAGFIRELKALADGRELIRGMKRKGV